MYILLILGLASEILAALAATFFFFKYKNTPLWMLLPLMWYIPINEMVCQFIFPQVTTGYILYNLYKIIAPITILFLTRSQLQNTVRRKAIMILIFLCIAGFVGNAMTIDPLHQRFTWFSMISAMLIVVGLLYYFIELLKSDRLINVNRDLFMWVSTGFLIFFLAYPVLALARNILVNDNMDLLTSINYIHFIVCILSYTVIAFGFYYGDKRDPITTKMTK